MGFGIDFSNIKKKKVIMKPDCHNKFTQSKLNPSIA